MIKIAGLQKMTLIDYPGKVAAAVFLAGCNFRCGFCHNPELVEIKPDQQFIPIDEFFDFLKSRQGLLDGVCVSGGEPLINQDLPEFLKQIKALGFAVKLDTNGVEAAMLKKIIDQDLVNYIAMDIKASLNNYPWITNVNKKVISNNISDAIQKSVNLIIKTGKENGLDYEFRTTILPRFHNQNEIAKIGELIKDAKKYYLQNFRNYKTLDPDFKNEKCFTEKALGELRQIALKYVKECEIRN